jgi:SNF2 family DNA or RNA helicase
MLVLPDKKAVVVKPRNAQQLLALLPTAKQVNHKGHTLVAVPHRLDEIRVLNNIGIHAPSPIKYHYKWSGMYTPFKAQQTTAAFLTLHRRAFVLNDLGTGKTLSVLWAYDYLRSVKAVKKMLVVCPLSTMERTWADELFRHFPHLDYVVLYGAAERRKKLLQQDADIYIVNHDGVKIIADELRSRDDIDIIIPDEIAQCARNARTDRWEVLNDIVNKQQQGRRWCWGMTGTPTPNAPTDAWAQCRLVNPTSVPQYFTRFKDTVMKQVNQFLWVPRSDATETVHKAMQPSIRFSRAECVDLPPCVFQTRHVELTSEQSKAYKEMLNRLKTDIDGGEVLAVNEAVKTSKLVQIAAGGVYSTSGEEVFVNAAPRLAVVDEIIGEAQGKVIVFVPFVSAVKMVAEYLRGMKHTVECIYGEVSKNERDRIFGAFQHGDEPRVIVAQPAAMSHGLTLTAANTIVWYAPIFSNDIYDQACARITRPGQTMAQLIVNIEGSPIERAMYERLKNKQRMQGILLTMVEEGRIEYAD